MPATVVAGVPAGVPTASGHGTPAPHALPDQWRPRARADPAGRRQAVAPLERLDGRLGDRAERAGRPHVEEPDPLEPPLHLVDMRDPIGVHVDVAALDDLAAEGIPERPRRGSRAVGGHDLGRRDDHVGQEQDRARTQHAARAPVVGPRVRPPGVPATWSRSSSPHLQRTPAPASGVGAKVASWQPAGPELASPAPRTAHSLPSGRSTAAPTLWTSARLHVPQPLPTAGRGGQTSARWT